MDRKRINRLEQQRRALVHEAKRLIKETVGSEQSPTDAERNRLNQLRAEQHVIDVELERAFYLPSADDA